MLRYFAISTFRLIAITHIEKLNTNLKMTKAPLLYNILSVIFPEALQNFLSNK